MIAKWHLKAFVQKCISYMPQSQRINLWFQKNVTKGVELTDEYFGYKITHAKDHLKFFKKHLNKSLNECTFLELGTGWYPIVPIALYLNDVKKGFTLDLSDWMTLENLIITCKKYVEWQQDGKLKNYLPNINQQKWSYIQELANAKTNNLNIKETFTNIGLTRIIGDARRLQFENNSIDLICSNNTFEHIPKSILIDILSEFKRVAKAGGVMCHHIDMSDHFAHFDKSINIYNFLKFSDKAWKRIDNTIQPQNRMRFKDYKAMYKQIDLPVTDEEYLTGNLDDLSIISINNEFKNYTPAELAISQGYLISKM